MTVDKGDQRPSAALLRLVNGFRVSQAIHVAAVTGTHPRSLYRVLRVLASVGVFREDARESPLGRRRCTGIGAG